MEDEVQFRKSTAGPARTPSKYISTMFSYLTTYDDDNRDSTIVVTADAIPDRPIIECNRFTPVTKEDMKEANNNISEDAISSNEGRKKKNQSKDDEFTIVTYVDNEFPRNSGSERSSDISIGTVCSDKSSGSGRRSIDTERPNNPFIINPVYEVTADDQTKLATELDQNTVQDKSNVELTNDPEQDSQDYVNVVKTDNEGRLSVIVEGEVVELRSPTEKRMSRQATWKENQDIVSEAFGYLKDEGEGDNTKSVFVSDSRPNRSPAKTDTKIVSEAFGFLRNLDDNADICEFLENQGILNEESGNVDTKDEPEVRVANVVSESKDSGCNVFEGNSGLNQPPDTADQSVNYANVGAQSEALNKSESGASEGSGQNDSLQNESMASGTEKLGKLKRRRPKCSSQSESSYEDDGGSSDEDTGVYQESFRKSTWLYVGDHEETKQASRQLHNYISLADAGLDTCDNDSVFGDCPSTPAPFSPGHKRNESTTTTASERDFLANSVSRRFVKRADSQQEYKRFTVRSFENAKVVTIERDAQTGFGIHILDCKPAVISGVDEGSPAERAGVHEGQVLVSINGVNVLDSDHSYIIDLVQKNSEKTLTLEVGGGDLTNMLNLQQPVKTGYMHKQTSSTLFKSWKKRYFILRRDGCLYYYKTEQETDPLGAIPLVGYMIKRHGDAAKCSFKAEKFNCRTFFFMAESKEEMTSWVSVMSEVTALTKNKDPWMDVTAQNVGLPALSIRNKDCDGYLFKMARNTRRWRKRYCVLKDACIFYYKSHMSKEADGVAHLHGYTVNSGDASGKKCSFSLHPPESQMRQFRFYTDNETDKQRWLQALDISIKKWIKVD